MSPNTPTPKKSDNQKESENDLVFSYLTLRNLIGISGMLLPMVLLLFTSRDPGSRPVEFSISNYYYTNTGDLLVVLLSILGVFLFTYNGYDWLERIITILSAICAIGIAFSPMGINCPGGGSDCLNDKTIHTFKYHSQDIRSIMHFVFSAGFFVFSAWICLVYFPKGTVIKSADGKMSQKVKRNMIFRICGWIMLLSVVILILYVAFQRKIDTDIPVVFIFEAIAIEAFGLAWITKGQSLFPDGKHYLKRVIQDAKATLN